MRRAGPDVHDSAIAVPFAVELADLLLIHLERERDLMIVLGCLGVHGRKYRVPGAKPRSECASTFPAYCDSECEICIVCSLTPLRGCPAENFRLRCYYCVFFFQQHLRKRRARRNHRENISLRCAIKYQQLRLRRTQKAINLISGFLDTGYSRIASSFSRKL